MSTPIRRPLARAVLAAAALVTVGSVAPAPLAGQGSASSPRDPEPVEPRLRLSILTGGAAFSAFRRQAVRTTLPGGAQRQYERDITAETTTALTLALAFELGSGWTLRTAVGFAPSSFVTRLEARDLRFLEQTDSRADEDMNSPDLNVWLGEAVVQRTLPTGIAAIRPYLLVGGGAVVYAVGGRDGSRLPIGMRDALADGGPIVRPAVVLGAGSHIRLRGSTLALTFELTDHVAAGAFDHPEQGVAERDGVVLEVGPVLETGAGSGVRLINHFRFAAGLTLPLG